MVDTVPTLNVNEVYGPVAQGEGPWAGRPQVFLRMAGCNLNCVWCDTPYSWDWTRYDRADEAHKMTFGEVAEQVQLLGGQHPASPTGLCITGGEPMVQAKGLGVLLNEHLHWAAGRVSIETNGTRPASRLLQRLIGLWVVSPKLANSEIPLAKRIKPEVLERYVAMYLRGVTVVFKFVVERPEDLEEVEALGLPDAVVWIMPQARSADEVMTRAATLEAPTLDRGWRMTLRQQVLLHGDRRGT